MKIHELFEANTRYTNNFAITVALYRFNDTKKYETKQEISKYLTNKMKLKNNDVTAWHNSCMVNIYNLAKTTLSNRTKLISIAKEVIDYIDSINPIVPEKKEEFLKDTSLYVYELRDLTIDFPSVSINAYEKMTLQNIDKQIKTEKLLINNCSRITGNVLGLFKFKCPITFREDWNSDINKLPEWAKIVHKYLPSGDMISCQEELMDAGLGEYAKK